MHSARFSLSCVVVTLSAVALLAISADGVWDDYANVAKSYGTGVVAAVVFLIPIQFVLSTVYKIYRERGTTLSQTERLAWYKSYLRNYPWLNVLIATVALIATLSSFTVYKGSVVGAQGYGFDPMFIAWDRMFFGGNDGWVVTHRIFDTAAATMWIDFPLSSDILSHATGLSTGNHVDRADGPTANLYVGLSRKLAGNRDDRRKHAAFCGTGF